MELLTILVADYANVTKNGKLNVMGIFKNIYASKFPAKHLSMTLVIKLGADLGEFDERKLTVKLLEADGKELMSLETPIVLPKLIPGQRPEINAIFQINEVVFPKAGRYQFSIFVDKDFKGSLPIDLILIESTEEQVRE